MADEGLFFEPATKCIFMKRKGFINNLFVGRGGTGDMRTEEQECEVRVTAEIVRRGQLSLVC